MCEPYNCMIVLGVKVKKFKLNFLLINNFLIFFFYFSLQFVNRQFVLESTYSTGDKEQREEWSVETEVSCSRNCIATYVDLFLPSFLHFSTSVVLGLFDSKCLKPIGSVTGG